MKKRGFSAIELMISLGFSLFVLLAAAEFFSLTRSLFLKLKRAEEANQSALAALDKMKIDLLRAGFGLVGPVRQGTVEGLTADSGIMTIILVDESRLLREDVSAGETKVVLESGAGLSPGREVCLADDEKSELGLISAAAGDSIVLSEPLEHSYAGSAGRMLVLEKITLYRDERSGAIRRKVNSSSPQPLLDDVRLFACAYDPDRKIARIGFALEDDQEKKYEIAVFPKNLGLALPNL